MHRGIVKQDIASLVKLVAELIEALDNDRRIDTAFDHVRIQVVVTPQKSLRHSDADYGLRSAPQWRRLSVARRKADRALSKNQPHQNTRDRIPLGFRGLVTGQSSAWLRLYCCGSGDCAGDFLIRFQIWLFLIKRLMVLVLTRFRVFCSIASTTFSCLWGVVEIRIHCLLLFSSEDRRTTATGTII